MPMIRSMLERSFPRFIFPHDTEPAQTPEFPPHVIRVNEGSAVNMWPWHGVGGFGDVARAVWHVCHASSIWTNPFVTMMADPRKLYWVGPPTRWTLKPVVDGVEDGK